MEEKRNSQTNKWVLTGTACSGKSTLIEELQKRGYGTIPESAREVIAARNHISPSHEENLTRQYLISLLQIEREDRTQGENIFLDRGFVDIATYCRVFLGTVPHEINQETEKRKYTGIFFLEKVPLVNDNVRKENEEQRQSIENELRKAYTDYGYRPILIPASSVVERANLIEYNITKLKGGD